MKIIKNLTFAALAATLLFQPSRAIADNSAPLLLTFQKSFADFGPDGYLFHFTGSIDGVPDTLWVGVRVGQTIDKQGQIFHIVADFEFTAANGIHSTACVEGNQNGHTGKALLNGVVTAGSLKGAQVQVQFEGLECPTLCFQGTIRLLPASAD